ncbi:hypothetical protein J3L11_14740 [Shewanella sp. 4t3-1-2LB]|uniref:hypothetical protein n=1 Tax=Shewanella sp. 4t3-1-2LB TaxID=2817682 RepID=UPI001A99F84D|nr:hypothetical protein [Shewanella sp. 4t3-1-2LB]MBO1272902.1 hypothetical protein [Shewanella sp. 4t3-1-2LB]
MPDSTAKKPTGEGFPAVKITILLSGRNNQKIQELRLERGGKETKAQLAENLLNEYLNKLPLKS